jgi:hypothetical protein
MWVLLSDLRFQADAAMLLCVMIVINGIAAMLLAPAWVLVFKPRFITDAYVDADGVIHADHDAEPVTPIPADPLPTSAQSGGGLLSEARQPA